MLTMHKSGRRVPGDRPLLALAALCMGAAAAGAADWPQWRGPARSGISSEKGWLAGWPEGTSPRVAWRAEVGKGHSAVSVSKGRAYTLGWDEKQDTVYCLDALSGRAIWKRSYASGTI